MYTTKFVKYEPLEKLTGWFWYSKQEGGGNEYLPHFIWLMLANYTHVYRDKFKIYSSKEDAEKALAHVAYRLNGILEFGRM